MPQSDDVVSNASSRRSGRGAVVDATAANSSTPLIFPESTLTRVLTHTFPLFGVLLSFRHANVHLLSLAWMALYALQQWAFLLNPRFAALWTSTVERVLVKMLCATQLNVYDRVLVPGATVTVDLVIAYVLLALVCALIVCIVLERRKKDDEKDYSSTTTNIARVVLDLVSSVLLVPIVSFCFAGLVCNGRGYMWRRNGDAQAVCWRGRHVAVFVPSLLVLLALLPLVYVKVACVYDYGVLVTANFLVQRHTLVEQVTLLLRVCSCFLYNVMVAYDVILGFACMQAIGALVLIGCYTYYLPYCVLGMNQYYVAVHAFEFVAALVVAVQMTYYNQRALYSPLVSFVCFGVAVALVAATVALHRVNPRFQAALRVATHGSAAYTDELDDDGHNDDDDDDGCSGLHDDIDDDDDVDGRRHHDDDDDDDDRDGMSGESAFDISDAAIAQLPFPRGLDVADEFSPYSGLTRQVAQSIMVQKMHSLVGSDGEVQKNKALPVLEPFVDRVYTVYDVNLSVASLDYFARRFGVTQVSSLMIMFGVHVYARALTRFPRKTWVMQRFVGFIVTYVPGMSFMAVDVLKQMLRLQPTLSERFVALRQMDELRAILGIRTHAHGLRCSKARTAHARVLQSLHRFWGKFIEPSVNIRDVSRVADDIHHRRRVAIEHFSLAIEHQQSADYQLLHQLGDFFADVMMAPDAAQECYLESREVYQARQARGMRGTRKNLAEVDIDALKKRILRLLHYHEHGGILGSRGSASAIWRFVVVATALFVVLLACAAAFAALATTLLSDMRHYLRAVDAAATLQVSASYFSAYTTTMTVVDADEAFLDAMVPRLSRELARFAQSAQTLTSAASAPRSDTARAFLTLPSIPFYTNAQYTQQPTSLLRLVEDVLREMSAFVSSVRAGATRDGVVLNAFLVDAGMALSSAAGIFVDLLQTDEEAYLARKWVVGICIVFLVNTVVLCVTYAVLVLSFRQTSMRRVFVFQLFTLIPYESVERLAMSMKERYYQMHQEKVLKRAPAGISDTLSTYTTTTASAAAAAAAAAAATTTTAAAASSTLSSGATAGAAATAAAGGSGAKDDDAHVTDATSAAAGSYAHLSQQQQQHSSVAGDEHGGKAALSSLATTTTTTTAGVLGGARPVVLKSCLRKPRAHAGSAANVTTTHPGASLSGAVAAAGGGSNNNEGGGAGASTSTTTTPAVVVKRVRFNPVVVVVDGEADDDAAAGADRGGDGSGARGRDGGAGGGGGGAGGDGSGADKAAAAARRRGVALSQARRYSRAAARKAVGVLRSGRAASLLTLIYLCLLFVCSVVTLCMLSVHFGSMPALQRRLDAAVTLQRDIAELTVSLEVGVRHAFVYLDSGSVARYMTSRNAFAAALRRLPSLSGPDVPAAALQRLFEMHHLAQTLTNATINASVLVSLLQRQAPTTRATDNNNNNNNNNNDNNENNDNNNNDNMNDDDDNRSSLAFLPELQPWLGRRVDDVAQTMRRDNARAAAAAAAVRARFADVDAVQTLAYAIALDAAATIVPAFHAAQSAAMRALAEHATTTLTLRSPYTLAALVLVSVAVGVSLLVALTPLGRLMDTFVSRPLALLAAASMLPVFVLVVLLYVPVLGGRLHSDFATRSEHLRALSTTVGTLFDVCACTAAYVATLDPLPWFRASAARELAALDVLHDAVLTDYLDADVVRAYASSATQRRALLSMSNISAALTVSALLDSGGRVEAPQRDGLAATTWDVTLEDGYVDMLVNEYATVYYSNKSADLAKPPATRYDTALHVLTSEQYRSTLDTFAGATTRLLDAVATRMREANVQLAHHLAGLLAAELLCALSLLVVLSYFYMLGMRMLSDHFVPTTDGGGGGGRGRHKEQQQQQQQQQQQHASAMEEPTTRFRHTMQRVRLTLLLLCVLGCSTFAVAVWLTQMAPALVAHQRYIGNERHLVAASTAAAGVLSSPHTTIAATGNARAAHARLATQLMAQTQDDRSVGVQGGLQLSARVNAMLYGDVVQNDALTHALSWLQTACGTFCSGLADALPPLLAPFYGFTSSSSSSDNNDNVGGGGGGGDAASYGVYMPVAQSVYSYVLDAARATFVADVFANDTMTQLRSMLPPLFNQTTSVLAALTYVSDVLLDVLTTRAQQLTFAFLALAIAELVVTVIAYAVVIVPIIVSYFREERASRLLLQMIPADVRDQVPAITHHVETGELTNVNELRMKFEANERLLQNILPPQIAARLKGGELPIADTHACVTMLFTDFVGFTKRSSTMRAREIVDFLNEVFLEFDTIVELLGLEKIKTIGDAFLMAGGLDPQVQDHALRVVEAGLMFFDALDAHNRRHPTRVPLQMRLGVHSGPVVAGVIGVKKVVFDLWGESVEIGNAMESTGVPGCVHISEDTARLVRGFFRLVPRGPLPREKEHIPEQMPATYLVAGRLLPTPYMNLRRPKLLPISLIEDNM